MAIRIRLTDRRIVNATARRRAKRLAKTVVMRNSG
jgi:hypothetical protein